MIVNYIEIVPRNLNKYTLLSFINVFGQAFTIAMCIALLSVGYQSIKAANANPVNSLQYE